MPNTFCMCAHLLSHVQLLPTLRTVANQTPLSMRLSWQKYCTGVPFLPPGNLPQPDIKASPLVPALAGKFFTIEPPRKPPYFLFTTVQIIFSWDVSLDFFFFPPVLFCTWGFPGGIVGNESAC